MTRISISVAAAITFAAMTIPAAEAANSYPLICQGGGDMSARVSANATIKLRFAPGTEAGAVRPGECTWIDRGFRPGEPDTLLLNRHRRGAEYIINGMLNGERFYVHGYNNQNGALVITRIGP